MTGTYEPRVFDAPNIAQAKRIILTAEGSATEERWAKETPYLAEMIGRALKLRPEMVLLDYGCGIGRLAKPSSVAASSASTSAPACAALPPAMSSPTSFSPARRRCSTR